jgi:hypothetical protein
MTIQTVAGKGAEFIGGGQLLNSIIAELIGQGAAGLFGATRSGLEPMTESGGQGSKYMITLPEAQRLELAFASENFRRSMLGLEPLDAGEFLAEREAALRESAAQAGQRDFARKQLEVQQAVVPAIAQLAGTQAQTTGGVAQQGIASLLNRPSIDPAVAAMATGR